MEGEEGAESMLCMQSGCQQLRCACNQGGSNGAVLAIWVPATGVCVQSRWQQLGRACNLGPINWGVRAFKVAATGPCLQSGSQQLGPGALLKCSCPYSDFTLLMHLHRLSCGSCPCPSYCAAPDSNIVPGRCTTSYVKGTMPCFTMRLHVLRTPGAACCEWMVQGSKGKP
eukprot:363234-Chlamydomonas_euryale.AAC.9